jgi:Ribonucleases G and E
VTIGYYSLDENKDHLFTQQGRSGKLRPGDELLVQLSRDAVKTKAPVLTANLSLPGRFCVLTAGKTGVGFSAKLTDAAWKNQIRKMLQEKDFEGFGIIVRTNAGSAEPEQILQECEKLKDQLKQLIKESSRRTKLQLSV